MAMTNTLSLGLGITVVLGLLLNISEVNGMSINKAGLDLIKKFEGYKNTSYQCPAGKWTIGYGHTETAEPNQVISESEAEILLKQDIGTAISCLANTTSVRLNSNQAAALTSFIYNVGCRAYTDSTLREHLVHGNYEKAANEFLRWTYAGGKKLKGLANRRKAEQELFLSALNKPI
jgi:lysozyme